MDLSRASNENKLNLCRWYFRAGFAFLPFVWAINAVWFFDEAFRKPSYNEQKQIKKYVLLSALGASIWIIALIIWITIYQLNRAVWGEFGEYISFIIPLGKV